MNLPNIDLVATPFLESLAQDKRFVLYQFSHDGDDLPIWDAAMTLNNIQKFVTSLLQIAGLLYADLTVKDVSEFKYSKHIAYCRISLYCMGDDWHSPNLYVGSEYNKGRFPEESVLDWVNSILQKAGKTQLFSIFKNHIITAEGKIGAYAANLIWTEERLLDELRIALAIPPFVEKLFQSKQTYYINQYIYLKNYTFSPLVPYAPLVTTLDTSKTVLDNPLPNVLKALGFHLFCLGYEMDKNSFRFLKEFSAIYLKGRVTAIQKEAQHIQICCDNQSFELDAKEDLETFIRHFNSFLAKIEFALRLYVAEDLPLGSWVQVFLCDKDLGTILFQQVSSLQISETFFNGSDLRYALTLPYVTDVIQVHIQRYTPKNNFNSELNEEKILYSDFTVFPIQPLPSMPEITPKKPIKIYTLREMGWSYNDGQASSYGALADIYESFDTYEAAWERKKSLEIELVKTNRCPHFFELAGRNPNWDSEFHAYVLQQLNLDIPKLCNEIKLPNPFEFRWHLHDFAVKQFAQNDKQIWDVLQLMQIDYYQIQIVEEMDLFYKIFLPTYVTNRMFAHIDFEGAYIPDQHEQAQVFDNYDAAIQEFSYCLRYFRFQGDWSDLSDMPDVLQAYVAQYPILQYDTNTKILSFDEKIYLNFDEERAIAKGLIPLLRNITQCIRSFTAGNYEGARILRTRVQPQRNNGNQLHSSAFYREDKDDDLPF